MDESRPLNRLSRRAQQIRHPNFFSVEADCQIQRRSSSSFLEEDPALSTASPHRGPWRYLRVNNHRASHMAEGPPASPSVSTPNRNSSSSSASPQIVAKRSAKEDKNGDGGGDDFAVFKVPAVPPAKSSVNITKSRGAPPPPPLPSSSSSLLPEPVMSDEDMRLYSEALYLSNWVPRIKKRRLVIEGDLLDFKHEKPNHYFPDRYMTSRVVERKRANLVLTKKRPYVLEGKLDVRRARLYSAPQFIISFFWAGFPESWKIFEEQWLKFDKDQAELERHAPSNLSSASSTIDQASGFLGLDASSTLRRLESCSTTVDFSSTGNVTTDSRVSVATGSPAKKKLPSRSTVLLPAEAAKPPIRTSSPRIILSRINVPDQSAPKLSNRSENRERGAKDDDKVCPSPDGRHVGKEDEPLNLWSRRLRNRGKTAAPAPRGVSSDESSSTGSTASTNRQNKKAATVDRGSVKGQQHPCGRSQRKEQQQRSAAPKAKGSSSMKPPTKTGTRQGEKLAEKAKSAASQSKVAPGKGTAGQKQDRMDKRGQAESAKYAPVPKTIKEIRNNERIMRAYNEGHSDDIFADLASSTTSGGRAQQGRTAAGMPSRSNCQKTGKGDGATSRLPKDILNELFESDSENNISLHSARTPIGHYIPDRLEDRHLLCLEQEEPQEPAAYQKHDYQNDRFINRQMQEMRKRSRLSHLFGNAATKINPHSRASQGNSEIVSSQLVQPISHLLRQQPGGADEEAESSTAADDDSMSSIASSSRSINNPPPGLLHLMMGRRRPRLLGR